jgi:hypothetical protein
MASVSLGLRRTESASSVYGAQNVKNLILWLLCHSVYGVQNLLTPQPPRTRRREELDPMASVSLGLRRTESATPVYGAQNVKNLILVGQPRNPVPIRADPWGVKDYQLWSTPR